MPEAVGGLLPRGVREPAPPSVLAVVLTYCAPEALDRCLTAIERQDVAPDALLVIDNDSQPRATIGGRDVPGRLIRREINDGPAGGYAAGLQAFLESGHQVAWVMDDDCIPDPECLRRLLGRHASLPEDRPVFPLWIDDATGDARVRPAWCGFLISAAVVREIGLPRAELVWWAEDTEYLQARLIGHDLVPVEERSAVVHHRRVRTAATKPAWKIYYETRNTIEYRFFVQPRNLRSFWYLIGSVAKLALQAARNGPRRGQRIGAYLRGLHHGFTQVDGLRMPLS